MFENFKAKFSVPSVCFCGPEHVIKKGWGKEEFLFHPHYENPKHLHDLGEVETVKLLHFEKNKKLSLHFHLAKNEYFRMLVGTVYVELVDLQREEMYNFDLKEGQKIFIPAGMLHRMTGMEEKNILIEISSLDKSEDSYRLIKGD